MKKHGLEIKHKIIPLFSSVMDTYLKHPTTNSPFKMVYCCGDIYNRITCHISPHTITMLSHTCKAADDASLDKCLI